MALYEFDSFKLDTREKLLFHNNQLVSLADQPCRLLIFLVENRGKFFTDHKLQENVWETFVEKENVSVNIHKIRAALNDTKPYKYIVTKSKRGYSFDFLDVIEIAATETVVIDKQLRTDADENHSTSDVNQSELSVQENKFKPQQISEKIYNLDTKYLFWSNLFVGIFLVVSSLFIHLISSLFNENQKITNTRSYFLISLFQLVVLSFLFVILVSPIGFPRVTKARWTEIAEKTYQQFLNGWSFVWLSWLALYFYLTLVLFVASEDIFGIYNVSIQITIDFLNIANSFAFFYLFLVLDIPSVSLKEDPDRDENFKRSLRNIGIVCLLVFLFSMFCRLVTNSNPDSSFIFGTYISGMWVGLSMCYFAGRFDSHYINVPRPMLAPLYCYAIIQLVGPGLVDYQQNTHSLIHLSNPIFFGFVGGLKLYLFIIIYYWLHNGALIKYFQFGTDSIERRKRNLL